MVIARRVLAEARRVLVRPGAAGLASAYAGLLVVVGLFAGFEASPRVLVRAAFVELPLLATPWAAHAVARDRALGLGGVQGASPLGSGEGLAGRAAGLGLAAVVAVALTLPTGIAVLAPSPHGTGLLPEAAAWGFGLAGFALVVGLIVGYAGRGRPRRALAGGFGLVFAWIVLARERARLLAAADGEAGRRFAQALVHASPAAWAEEGLAAAAPGGSGSWPPGLGLALLGLLAVVALVASATAGRSVTEVGLLDRGNRGALWVLVVAGLLASVLLAGWSHPDAVGPLLAAPADGGAGPGSVEPDGVRGGALAASVAGAAGLALLAAWLPARWNRW